MALGLHLHMTPIPASVFSHGLLHVCFFLFCLLWGHVSLDLGPTWLFQDALILRALVISVKTLFPNKAIFTGTKV